MTREEKLQLNNERKRAVKEAWSREKNWYVMVKVRLTGQ